jgi:hypothetical protein
MKRASTWLVSVLIAASAMGAPAPAVAARTAHVWSNSDAFSVKCLGVNDTYPNASA